MEEFIKGTFNEAELETAIIQMFENQEYEYVNGYSIHCRSDNILLENDLRSYLTNLYRDLTPSEITKVISKLKNIPYYSLYQGNRETFWLLNEGFDFPRDDSSQLAIHIDYIDFEHPENNTFKVVNQYTVDTGRQPRRPDVLLFINGIPVAIFEFKTAIQEETTIHDAWKQITIRYNRDIPNLMKYCMLTVISDGANTKMGSIFTPYEYFYAWNKANDEEKVSNGISALFTMIKGAFTQERLLAILRDFIYYPDDSPKNEAIVTRYPQFFAANKMLANIKEHLKPGGDGKGGTYFGAVKGHAKM